MRPRSALCVIQLLARTKSTLAIRGDAPLRKTLLLRTGSSGLAGLLLQDLADVADPLLLVRIRLAQAADLRRHLADTLPVDAGDGQAVRLRVHRDLDPFRDREDHGVRVAEREHDLVAFDRGLEADPHDVELLAEARRDAHDGVVREG